MSVFQNRAEPQASKERIDPEVRVDLNELEMVLEPILELATGKIESLEAQRRWTHPSVGCLGSRPLDIRLAKQGLLLEVGAWTLERIAKLLAPAPFPIGARLAVNVSPVELRNPSFARDLLSLFSQVGADPGRLKLEISEDRETEDPVELRNMTDLVAEGVEFALDELGESSVALGLLCRLPLSEVKLSSILVGGLDERKPAAELTRTAVGVAQSLGLSVGAEGVETSAQFRVLQDLDVDRLQGPLVGGPVSLPMGIDLVGTRPEL